MASYDPNETQLIAGLRAGDEAALVRMMREYQGRVFGLALRLTGSRQDAEEVFQDVFLTVFRKIEGFRGDSKLSTWIYRITTNVALMRIRKRPKIADLPLEEELGPSMTPADTLAEPVADWSHLPFNEVARKELLECLEAALAKLPVEYRSVFVLRDIEGLPAEEACAVLNLSTPALKSRLHRARLFVRKELADYAVSRHPEVARLARGHQS